MYHTPSDVRERHAFTENAVQDACDVFAHTKVAIHLYGVDVRLADLMDTVVIPNVVDGVVSIPDAYDDTDALPVVALRTHESLMLGDSFLIQSPTQVESTAKELSKWQPAYKSPEQLALEMAENFRINTQGPNPSFTVREGTSANSMTAASVFDMDVSRQNEGFANAPKGRLGKFLMRPIVGIVMIEKEPFLEERFGHELVHVIQKIHEPIRVFASQKKADMHELRKELEAYHVGAAIRMRLEGIADIHGVSVEDMQNEQIGVEAVRSIVNAKDIDPFRPSPLILRELEEIGWGHILHSHLPYDQLVAGFDAFNAAQNDGE